MLKVSIVINTLNRRDYLERALNSLQYLRYPHFEVICVNGPSTDGTDELLKEWSDRIKIGFCPEANLSMSRNIGIRMAAADIVCFIDDDAVPEPGWLSGIVSAYEDNTVGAVGGYIRDNTGMEYQCRKVFCDCFADTFASETDTDDETHVALTGANCSFRREALQQIGGFDEVFAYFLDETDVEYRIKQVGWEIKCIEGAEIHHKFAPSNLRTEKRIPRTLYYPVRSKIYYAWRHAIAKKTFTEVSEWQKQYLSNLRKDTKWYIEAGEISASAYQSLVDDIERGQRDGFRLAFNIMAPFTQKKVYFEHPPTFKQFNLIKSASNRLKICFISQDYFPQPNGGIGVWIGTLAKELAKSGHEVTVITRTTDNPGVEFENNVWVHRINVSHWPDRPFSAPDFVPQIIYDWAASAYAELLKVDAMRSVDLVSAPIWDVEGIVAHCSGRFKVALSLHTTYGMALPAKPEWKMMPEYMDKHVNPVIETEKKLLLEAPLILANSKCIAADLEKAYGIDLSADRIFYVPHGLEDVEFDKEKNSTGEDELNLLFVGRFEKRKGIETLLEAIPIILNKWPFLKINLVGNNVVGDYWNNFKQKYEHENWFKKLNVPGLVNSEILFDYYKACDIFVAPSLYESFGLIFIEAMRFGKPCIGTKVGGIPEVVEDKINGFLVNPNSLEEFLKYLEKLIEDKELRIAMGNKSREIFLKKFTSEKMSSMIEKVFSIYLNKF